MGAEVPGGRAKVRSLVTALPCSCPFPPAPTLLPQSQTVYGTLGFLGMSFEKHGFKGTTTTRDLFPSSASQNIKGGLWFHIPMLLPSAFPWGLIQGPLVLENASGYWQRRFAMVTSARCELQRLLPLERLTRCRPTPEPLKRGQLLGLQ